MELLVERVADRVRLLAPDAGLFTGALPRGAALAPRQPAGTLLRLGRATALVVPGGVAGRVVSQRPERVHEPVGFRAPLYELAPFPAAGEEEPGEGTGVGTGEAPATGALWVLAPQSGRFYHRPAPDEAPFVAPGDLLEEGLPLGMIEVMKTFATLPYRAVGGLPPRARLVRLIVADGGDVVQGEPLAEVQPT